MLDREAWRIHLVQSSMSKENDLMLRELARYEAEFPDDLATSNYWKAFVESRKGNVKASIDLYSAALIGETAICSKNRMARADAFISIGEFAQALVDVETCLTDSTPLAIERFHPSLKYRKAFLLAALGEPSFETAVEDIPPGYSEFLLGARRDATALNALYQQSTTSKR